MMMAGQRLEEGIDASLPHIGIDNANFPLSQQNQQDLLHC
jgi:hypothetical protein